MLWPAPGLSPGYSVRPYALLHKAVLHNWTPTTNKSKLVQTQAIFLYFLGTGHPIDFGKVAFSHIYYYIEKPIARYTLPFPSLIYGILLDQGIERKKGDAAEQTAKQLIISKATIQNAFKAKERYALK